MVSVVSDQKLTQNSHQNSGHNKSSSQNVVIVIPARLESARLPNKPLADIGGIPMIVRVWKQAIAANVGPVIVACCGPEIRQAIEEVGGIAIETAPDLPSGSDRIMEALRQFDPSGIYKVVVNLQGDLPTIPPSYLETVLLPLKTPDVQIGSLCGEITVPEEIGSPHVVKIAAGAWREEEGTPIGRAVYFSRLPVPANATTHYHHVGIYAYRRSSLEEFIAMPPSSLEVTEKLENLRAIEAGMRIDVALIPSIPPSVDTQEDLLKVRLACEIEEAVSA